MLPSPRRLAQVAAGFALFLAGCSLALDADEPQCRTDGDCAKRLAGSVCVASLCTLPTEANGGAGGQDGASGQGGEAGEGQGGAVLPEAWACLGQIPKPVGDVPTVKVRLPLLDFISRVPRKGVTVRVCGQLDVECKAPIGAAAVSGDDGIAIIDVPAQPAAFNGFFRIDETPEVMASLVFAQPLVATDGATLSPVLTFVLAEYRALVEAGGNVWNDARGHIFVQARDCTEAAAAGVTYSIEKLEADTVRVFLRDGAPDRNAPDTDATGIGGFILAGEGYHTVRGTLSASGTLVNERRIFVRPSTVSYTVMSPAP